MRLSSPDGFIDVWGIAGDEAKFIEQSLAKGQPDKKTIRAVKAAAWRVATRDGRAESRARIAVQPPTQPEPD